MSSIKRLANSFFLYCLGIGVLLAILSSTTSARTIEHNSKGQDQPSSAKKQAEPSKVQDLTQNSSQLEFSIGNLSVPFLLKKWGSPLLDQGIDASRKGHKEELNLIITDAKTVTANSIEDYVGWAVVEPTEGNWRWQTYKQNANTIINSRVKYTPYVWMQNLPSWVRYNPNYRHATCVEHGMESEALSIFDPQTTQLFDRFFGEMQQQLGSQISLLRVGSPNDFGEATYPVGNATFAFPDKHLHPGFWVDEPEARANFKEAMKSKYNTINDLNSAWGTEFASFELLAYPLNASQRRWWLDFVNWYHATHTERLGGLMDVILKHFPTTPINLNFGFPDERIIYGQDLTGLTKVMAAKGLHLRTPTGNSVPFFYTKRIATAVNYYKPQGFSSEPIDGDATINDIASAVFKDLTTGITLHFDYPSNLVRGKSLIDQERLLWQGKYPEIDSAIFFSTTGHRLDDSQRDQGFKGYPDNLAPFTEALRDIIDYDVVDEQLITDGALANYHAIIWPIALTTEATTLAKLRAWVEAGGVLIVGDLASISTVEGDKGVFADLAGDTSDVLSVGKGLIYNAHKDIGKLAGTIATRPYARLAGHSSDFLPPLDVIPDGILTSEFDNGILLFNKTDKVVTKKFSLPEGSWRVTYHNLPDQVELPPLAIRWIDGQTGQIK